MFQSFIFVPFMIKKNVSEFRIRTIYDKKNVPEFRIRTIYDKKNRKYAYEDA